MVVDGVPQELWLNIQNAMDLEPFQEQQQANGAMVTFQEPGEGSTGMTATPIRSNRSDTSVLGDLPIDFFDMLNGDGSNGTNRRQSTGPPIQDIYGNFERTGPDATSFNNYSATDLAVSSAGRGHTLTNSQFATAFTPQYMQNFSDDITPPDTTDSPNANTCECLDKQVRLLFRMDKVEQAQKKSSPDVALVGARDAMEQWEALRQCTACQSGSTGGVFLMFVMSMRFLLRALRCSFANAAVAGAEPMAARRDPAADSATHGNWRVSMGQYEAYGEEYKLTSRMLIILAVQRIETALAYAKTRLQQRQAAARLEAGGNKERAEAIEIFDKLVQGDQRALLTENGFDSRVGLLLLGLEGIIGSN